MKFQFDSLQAFLNMGGHGPYVWAAYTVTLVLLVWLLANPLLQKKRFLRHHLRQQQLNELRTSQSNQATVTELNQ